MWFVRGSAVTKGLDEREHNIKESCDYVTRANHWLENWFDFIDGFYKIPNEGMYQVCWKRTIQPEDIVHSLKKMP